MTSSAGSESEIKLSGVDHAALRERLEAAGAELEIASVRERNLVFDDASGNLRASARVLRLRRVDGKSILTYKGRAHFEGAVKVRAEHESGVADGAQIEDLLAGLGFAPAMIYEKDRETWRLDGVEILLDHTPLGDFVELEGETEALEGLASRLGLDPTNAVEASYLELWAEHRRSRPEVGRHMVFTS